MKPSEFYTKYWKVTMPDGSVVSPPPLTEKECLWMDEVMTNPNIKGIYIERANRRKKTICIDAERMKEDMNRLPEFLKLPQ